MTLGYPEALRNIRLNEVTALVDAGSGPAKIRIFDGTRPVSPETSPGAAVQLVEFAMSDPSFGAASAGKIVANFINFSAADASGVATWFRLLDSNDNAVIDGDIGAIGSGADLEFTSTTIAIAQNVLITSFELSQSNP